MANIFDSLPAGVGMSVAAPPPNGGKKNVFDSVPSTNVFDTLPDLSRVKPGIPTGMPSQFSSGYGPQVPISENPDWQFTRATRGSPVLTMGGDVLNALNQKVIGPVAAAGFNAMAKLGENEAGIVPPKGTEDVQFEAGKPMLPEEAFPLAKEKGILPALTRTALGFTTPESALTLPFAPASKAVQGAFLAQTAAGVPDTLEKLASAQTPSETRDALTELGVQAAMGYMMGKGNIPKGLFKAPAGEIEPPTVPIAAPQTPPKPIEPAATLEQLQNLQQSMKTGQGEALMRPQTGSVLPPVDTSKVEVRTPDGQIDPVATAIARFKLEGEQANLSSVGRAGATLSTPAEVAGEVGENPTAALPPNTVLPESGKSSEPVPPPNQTQASQPAAASTAPAASGASLAPSVQPPEGVLRDVPISTLVGKVVRWNGIVGTIEIGNDGRPLLNHPDIQDGNWVSTRYELPHGDLSASEAGIEVLKKQPNPLRPFPPLPKNKPSPKMPSVTGRISPEDLPETMSDLADTMASIKDQIRTSGFQPDPGAVGLIDATHNVATMKRPPLSKAYGALEAVPTVKRMVTGIISRLESEGRGDETGPWYDKLDQIEQFENKYQEAVTKPTQSLKPSDLTERLASSLESLKSGISGSGQLHAFGVAADLWDRAIKAAQKAIRAGGSVADAINAAIQHIKDNFKGAFQEPQARAALEKQLNQPAKPLDSLKGEMAQADADLRAKASALANPDAGTQKERKQAAAVAAARHRTLRDELATHPDYVAEQILKQHQAITEANQILKPMGKTVSPDDFPNPSEVSARLGNAAAQRVNALADQIVSTSAELARTNRLAPKMVDRITGEMMADGRLPKMAEMTDLGAGRTLQKMTDSLRNSDVDSPKASFAERLAAGKRIAALVTKGRDAVTRAWGNSVAAAKALSESFRNAPEVSDFKNVIKSWIGYDQRTAVENYQYRQELNAKVTNPVRRQAISAWLDAGGDEGRLRFERDSVPDNYRSIWDAALKLTSDEKRLALQIKDNFAAKLQDATNAGLLEKGRADYGVPQRWKTAPQIGRAADVGEQRGQPGNPYAKLDPRDPFFSFQRHTDSYFDGIMAKGVPENLDIGHLVSVYDEAFHKALSSRGAIKALTEATARDGQPVTKLSGGAVIKPGDEGGVMVDSKSLPKDAMTADGRPYRSIDHWAMRGWKFAAKDAAGKPIFLKGDMLVHPDHYDFLKNELNTPRWTVRATPGDQRSLGEKIGRGALATSGFLKASKFIGPFHIVTEALHASFHGVVPSVHDFEINLEDAKQALLNRNMTLGFGRAREMFEDGLGSHGGIWSYVPGLGDAIVRLNHFTFDEYIPKLKMKVGLAVLDRNMATYSNELSTDQIAEITGRQMDAAFGGQNWRMMGTNKNMLAVARLAFVAPDFLLSRAKFIGQAFKPYNREQRIFLAAQAFGVYALCRVANSIFSDDHDPHFELRNWDSVVVGKRAYHARFIVSDAANLARDLLGFGSFNQHGIPFITGRLGVVPKTGIEALTGKDLFTGQNKDGLFQTDNPALKAFSIVAKDVSEWMTPMAVDGFIGGTAKGQSGLGQVAAATFGVSSRKESPIGEVWDLARQYNLKSQNPATVNYQKQRDNSAGQPSAYRALDNLLDAGDMKGAQAEYNRLKADGRTPVQIAARYDRTVAFTGNQTRETQFFASLTPEQKVLYQKARVEQQARRAEFLKLSLISH